MNERTTQRDWLSWVARWIVRGAAVVLLAIALFIAHTVYMFWSRNWSNGEIAQSKAAGTALAVRIKDFATEARRLPKSLSELTPPPEPPVAGMREWEYRQDGVRFFLRVVANPRGYPSFEYDSQTDKWTDDM